MRRMAVTLEGRVIYLVHLLRLKTISINFQFTMYIPFLADSTKFAQGKIRKNCKLRTSLNLT